MERLVRRMLHRAHEEAGVNAAETECVAEDMLRTLVPAARRNDIEIAGGVLLGKVGRARKVFLIERQRADCCLYRAGCAKGVPVQPLGAADRDPVGLFAQCLTDGEAFS